jgi:hypothetical protein
VIYSGICPNSKDFSFLITLKSNAQIPVSFPLVSLLRIENPVTLGKELTHSSPFSFMASSIISGVAMFSVKSDSST